MKRLHLLLPILFSLVFVSQQVHAKAPRQISVGETSSYACSPINQTGESCGVWNCENQITHKKALLLETEKNGVVHRRIAQIEKDAVSWVKPIAETRSDGSRVHYELVSDSAIVDSSDLSEVSLLDALLNEIQKKPGCQTDEMRAQLSPLQDSVNHFLVEPIKDTLDQLLSAVDSLIPKFLKCDQELPSKFPLALLPPLRTDQPDLPCSILSVEKAQKIFNELATRPEIPFQYPEDGCYARAHRMCQLMEEQGIISEKIFADGNLRVETDSSPDGFVEWAWHVAPVVMVAKDGKPTPMVFDPSLFDHPVTINDWIEHMTGTPKTQVNTKYFTTRFTYMHQWGTAEISNATHWSEYDFGAMNSIMRTYLDIQNLRKNLKSPIPKGDKF